MEIVNKLSIPTSWLPILGTVKALAAVGLITGLFIPVLSEITAACLIVFFVGAIITHLRVGDRAIGGAVFFLAMAVAVLVLALASKRS